MNSITQDMKFRYSLMRYAEKFGCRATIDLGKDEKNKRDLRANLV